MRCNFKTIYNFTLQREKYQCVKLNKDPNNFFFHTENINQDTKIHLILNALENIQHQKSK